MSIGPIPTTTIIVDPQTGRLTMQWQGWLSRAGLFGGPLGSAGTTANRPQGTSQVPLFVGQPYFDVTLMKPVWVQSLNPTVWCDATGAAV